VVGRWYWPEKQRYSIINIINITPQFHPAKYQNWLTNVMIMISFNCFCAYLLFFYIFTANSVSFIYSKTAMQAVKKWCSPVWQPYARWPGWKSSEIQVEANKWLWWSVYGKKKFNNNSLGQFVLPLPSFTKNQHKIHWNYCYSNFLPYTDHHNHFLAAT